MNSEEQVLFGALVLFLCISILGLLLIILDYISRSLNEYNEKKAIVYKEKNNIKHTENIVKPYDYDVEFNINLKDSIVRTEVVYTE